MRCTAWFALWGLLQPYSACGKEKPETTTGFLPYLASSGLAQVQGEVGGMRAYRFTLADDDSNMLFVIPHMLSRRFPNSSIASFSNAEDALNHILDSGTDLLITDHGMGRMGGTELIRELRRRSLAVPIIMVSGNPEAAEEARRAGATEFLNKNVGTKVLEAHVRNLIRAGPKA
jgi:DNA-binding response OmpR family regulator